MMVMIIMIIDNGVADNDHDDDDHDIIARHFSREVKQ